MFIVVEEQGQEYILRVSDDSSLTALCAQWRARTDNTKTFVDWLEFHGHAERVTITKRWLID